MHTRGQLSLWMSGLRWWKIKAKGFIPSVPCGTVCSLFILLPPEQPSARNYTMKITVSQDSEGIPISGLWFFTRCFLEWLTIQVRMPRKCSHRTGRINASVPAPIRDSSQFSCETGRDHHSVLGHTLGHPAHMSGFFRTTRRCMQPLLLTSI